MPPPPSAVTRESYDAYLDAVQRESERAWLLYDLLVVPGLELTYEEHDPNLAAHAVAVGLREFVDVEPGLDGALARARGAGAALIAAHPYEPDDAGASLRRTCRWAVERERSAELVDRFELFNRHELFAWVAEARLPAVANGDFHVPEHLATWKTLLPCRKEEAAIIDYLRSPRPAYVVDLSGADGLREAA